MAKITGYKGFDKDFKCRGMQYEVGKTFTADKADICQEGLHFCTDPMDVLKYYPVTESRYAIVSTDEELIVGSDDDSKKCTTKLTIEKELSLKEFIHAITSSKVVTSGVYPQLASSGDYSKLKVSGKNSVACAIGYKSIAKGVIGSWLVLADYRENDEGKIVINGGKWLKVDGGKIKENTFYKLVDGEPVAVEE